MKPRTLKTRQLHDAMATQHDVPSVASSKHIATEGGSRLFFFLESFTRLCMHERARSVKVAKLVANTPFCVTRKVTLVANTPFCVTREWKT